MKNPNNKQWPQYLAVLTASIASFSIGLHYSWSSPSYPKLIAPDYPLNITPDEASYAAIIFPLGDMIGAPIAASIADIIGRKNGILLISLPTFISWMLIAFAQNVWMLYVGRFFGGIGEGFLFLMYPMYIGEVTEPKIRGFLGCALPLSMCIGMLSINSYAPFLSIKNAALVSSVFSIILLISFVWMPESPYFYLMKGKYEEAKKSLIFLRRCKNVETELQQIRKDVERQMSERGTMKDLFIIESNRKSLLITLGIRTIQQFSGISAWSLFTQTIFIQAGGFISPVIATIIYVCTQLTTGIFGSLLMDKFGRRPLLFSSAIGSGISLICGGTYFYIKEMTDIDTTPVSWLPLLVMIAFIINYSFGLGIVPTLLLSEMFSTSIKSKALCIMSIYYAGMLSLTSKLFYYLTETFGMYAPFYTFGSACLISVIFSYFFMPETKGKSLEDIQQHLKNNHKTISEKPECKH